MNATTCFLAELVGTAMLILLGNGVVANVLLEKSGMKGGGTVQITFGWGLAVLLPAFIFGAASGAHFNPALTIALAADGTIAPRLVGWYISGQMLGAMLGATLVWALFYKHYHDIPVITTFSICGVIVEMKPQKTRDNSQHIRMKSLSRNPIRGP